MDVKPKTGGGNPLDRYRSKQIVGTLSDEFAVVRPYSNAVRSWRSETDFYPVLVLKVKGLVLFPWGSQSPARHWSEIMHPRGPET